MNAVLTLHAQEMLAKRGIDPAWVELALLSPQLVQADKVDPALEHRFVKIAENGGRVLKVVVNKIASPERVVSAYFDRRMKEAL